MCVFTKENQLDKCGVVEVRTLTDEEKTFALDAHNAKRRIIAHGKEPGQPSAANMIKLVRLYLMFSS
jgi:hypothetical protein